MDSLKTTFFLLCAMSTTLKILLLKSYRSTDFEVHRNWLAITHSSPWSEWYTTAVSEWTLDYPPLFAWFEKSLTYFANVFDSKMLILDNLDYASHETVLFLRLSVIVTDFVYFYSIYRVLVYNFKSRHVQGQKTLVMAYSSLFIFNFGLFIVDHIHFQYNGVLTGIWILSIVDMLEEKWIFGSFWFSILLNMKHIYLYVAPAYFIYILRYGCLAQGKLGVRFNVKKFIQIGFTVATVFGISFGPFIAKGLIRNVLSRLFPFKRGLCHAYWAPNIWAMYNVVDKVLYYSLRACGVLKAKSETASMTGGMVKEFDHAVLPSIRPILSIILTALLMLPILWRLFSKPSQSKATNFLEAMTLCGWTSYMFGWHVHEKAIIMIIIPVILLIPASEVYRSMFLLISTTGHYSLLPLIFTPAETVFKVSFLLLSAVIAEYTRQQLTIKGKSDKIKAHSVPRTLYLLGFVALFLFTDVLPFTTNLFTKFAFLPLLLTSLYCSLGIIYSYVLCYKYFIS